MKKWRKGYAVKRKYGNHYRSFLRVSPFVRIYNIGVITKRLDKDGPLAVFGQKRDAERFLRNHEFGLPCAVILRCRYTVSKDESYWHTDGSGNRKQVWPDVPGKRFADEVELLEEVERSEDG